MVNGWKVILATMVIFGTGVVTGGLLVRSVERSREHRPQRAGAAIRPGQLSAAGLMRIELLRRLERELELTAEQRASVDRILRGGQDRMKKLMQTVEPRRREEYRKTVEEFRAVLTPEQRKRLDTLLQQQQRAREQRKAAPRRERPVPAPPAATNL
jgi:isopentenyl diphosphate isomerase/L-lactate dehydrogenase-like FMN-dependent dehydrogenase